MAASDADPRPRKGQPFRYYFAIRSTSGGKVTSWASPAATISRDGGAFGAASNVPVEIGASGYGYIDLTGPELDANGAIVDLTVANAGALPHAVIFYPEEAEEGAIPAMGLNRLRAWLADPENENLEAWALELLELTGPLVLDRVLYRIVNGEIVATNLGG